MSGSLLVMFSLASLGLFNFEEDGLEWQIVNDTVMGGRSQAKVEKLEGGGVVFSGKVSLENNGGFASFRSKGASALLSSQGSFNLKVRGDGRAYTMDLRTSLMRGAFSWKQEIQTQAGEIQSFELPLEDFYPTSFGKKIPFMKGLAPSAVRSLGFMLYDGKGGPFRLEIIEMQYIPSNKENPKTVKELIELAISLGVPLFNRGEAEACAAIYETTLKSAVLILKERGLKIEVSKLEGEIVDADMNQDGGERAWAYRRIMDRLHNEMKEK